MSTNTISILEGNTFVVSDRRGDIEGSPTDTQGFFADDTRFLSRWVLTANGIRPSVLSTDDVQYFEAKFFLAPSSGTIYVDVDMSIMRKRVVGRGFVEEIIVENHSAFPKEMDLKIEAASDFADLFEVKDQLKKKGEYYRRVEDDTLVLGYKRDTYLCETPIKAPGATFNEAGLRYRFTLEPHAEWSTSIDVSIVSAIEALSARQAARWGVGQDRARQLRVEQALALSPRVRTDWLPLIQTYQRSVIDTAALRFFPLLDPTGAMPAAGLPWFMAVFGRDSIIMSLQMLPFVPQLAATTLKVLATRQGTRVDGFRDEEPGKILHESRLGEMTAFTERPHSPYFGSADGTPLFLVLLDEYERWTGDADLVRRSSPSAHGPSLDRRVQRPPRQRVRLVQAPRGDGPRQPVLERLVELDPLPGRHALEAAARVLRDPGVRVRREDALRPAGAQILERPCAGRPARARGGQPQGALQPRLLDARSRVLRARHRRRPAPGRLDHVEHRPPALERDRR